MIRYLSNAGQWCRTNRKLFVCLFVLFVLLSCGLLESVYVLARSSYVPPITVRAIDIDTRQPIKDALITINYHTGFLNATTKVQESRITNTDGEVEFPSRMIWAYLLVPDFYTDARLYFQHYYFVEDSYNPSWIVRDSGYLASPVYVEVTGRNIDNLGAKWINQLYTNLETTFQILPKYYGISTGPQESPEQILQYYESTFNQYASNGVEYVIEQRYRDKFAELRMRGRNEE